MPVPFYTSVTFPTEHIQFRPTTQFNNSTIPNSITSNLKYTIMGAGASKNKKETPTTTTTTNTTTTTTTDTTYDPLENSVRSATTTSTIPPPIPPSGVPSGNTSSDNLKKDKENKLAPQFVIAMEDLEILEAIGEGGFCRVHKARFVIDRSTVAVKKLKGMDRPSEATLNSFKKEILFKIKFNQD